MCLLGIMNILELSRLEKDVESFGSGPCVTLTSPREKGWMSNTTSYKGTFP